MIVDELKKSILESAVSGNLTTQDFKENANSDLEKIISAKKEYLSKYKLQDNLKFKVKVPNKKIPDNWVWSSVGELCFVTKLAGFEYTKYMTENLSENGEIPVIRAQNIKPNLFIDDCSEYISRELSNQLYRCALDCKCTLMTFIGAGIGETAVFDKKERYHLAPNVAKIVPGLDINKYLMYYFMSPLGKSQVFQYVKQTAQPSLSIETIRSVAVPLPPLSEIDRIVNKIEELFFKLDEIKPIEEKLNTLKNRFPEEMKKSVLQQAYEGKWSLDHESWNKKKISDICNEICTGNSISESVKKNKYLNLEDGYNYIGTKDLDFDHTFDYENGVKIPFDEPKFRYANINDILLCIEGGSAGKKIGILEEKVCYGNKLCKFEVKDDVLPKFLYYYLQSPIFLKNFFDKISGIIGGVSISKIRTIEFEYPDVEEQKRIVEKIEAILPIIESINSMY